MRMLTLSLLLIVCSSGPVHAAGQISEYCESIFSIAASAYANRAEGVPESRLRGALPPRADASKQGTPQVQLLLDMHDMIDQVYSFQTEEIDSTTYSTYQAEVCHRREQNLPVPENFDDVAAALRRCTSIDGNAKYECAMNAAGATPDGR